MKLYIEYSTKDKEFGKDLSFPVDLTEGMFNDLFRHLAEEANRFIRSYNVMTTTNMENKSEVVSGVAEVVEEPVVEKKQAKKAEKQDAVVEETNGTDTAK